MDTTQSSPQRRCTNCGEVYTPERAVDGVMYPGPGGRLCPVCGSDLTDNLEPPAEEEACSGKE
jgi:rRNA maturation endonuclease Nob1